MSFEQPNYTQAPNTFFDNLLKEIDSMSELKVTLAVIRHTFGFHRDEHELSLSYLVRYTGMKRDTVIDGLKRAMRRGTVSRRKSGDTFAYFVVVQKSDHPSPETGPVPSPKIGPKKERGERKKDTPKGVDGRPSAAEFVAQLDERLKDSTVTLTASRKARYGREFKNALDRGRTASELDDVVDRICERWEDAQLSVDNAMRDCQTGRQTNGGKPRESAHPQSPDAAKSRDEPRPAWWYVSTMGGDEAGWQRRIEAGEKHSELVA